jgi:D-threo-aldose 1-dehydrogenase
MSGATTETTAAMPRRALRTALERTLSFTEIGFGAAPIGNMGAPITDFQAIACVRTALDSGVGYVDVAPLYGHGLSEQRIGAALRGRENVLLSTKVGRLLEPCTPGEEDSGIYKAVPHVRVRYAYDYDGIMRSFEDSLIRLVHGIDILFVHDIDAATHGSAEASEARFRELIDDGGWKALDELRRCGDVQAIGAGANDTASCLRLTQLADPDVFLLAGRYTLLDQCALDDLLPRCEARGIGVVIGGPFNSGILATGPVAGAWYDYGPAPEHILERVRRIEAICATHGVPLAAAALRFPLLHPAVQSVIPGAKTRDEVARNLALADLAIPATLWADLRTAGLIHEDAPC